MQRNRIQLVALTGAIVMVAGLATPVRAQEPDDMQRGVARISVMDGQVSVRRGDAGEWVAGVINAPLMADDSIATAPNSRAEVQFDSADILRIGGNAQVHLTALEMPSAATARNRTQAMTISAASGGSMPKG